VGLQERNRWRLDILCVKKEAKLSARKIPGVEEGKGEEDLRCKFVYGAYTALAVRITSKFHENFCTLAVTVLGLLLTTVQQVVYFRFYG